MQITDIPHWIINVENIRIETELYEEFPLQKPIKLATPIAKDIKLRITAILRLSRTVKIIAKMGKTNQIIN